jgi:hypothetical protein
MIEMYIMLEVSLYAISVSSEYIRSVELSTPDA